MMSMALREDPSQIYIQVSTTKIPKHEPPAIMVKPDSWCPVVIVEVISA
jgi:hypothetical protein